MKTSDFYITSVLCAFLISPIGALAGASSHVVFNILSKAGAGVLEQSAREAAERSAAQAVKVLGQEAAEAAVQRGGLAILEAGARHGDDFWSLARKVPEASQFLAAHSDEALALARAHGPEAVRLEGMLPGLGREAAGMFGSQGLPIFLKAGPEEAARMIVFAKKADSPATRDTLFKLWIERGSVVLDELDKRKALILAGGLTIGMLEVADGVADATRELPTTAPQVLSTLAGKFGNAVIMVSTLLSVGVLVWVLRRFPHRGASR